MACRNWKTKADIQKEAPDLYNVLDEYARTFIESTDSLNFTLFKRRLGNTDKIPTEALRDIFFNNPLAQNKKAKRKVAQVEQAEKNLAPKSKSKRTKKRKSAVRLQETDLDSEQKKVVEKKNTDYFSIPMNQSMAAAEQAIKEWGIAAAVEKYISGNMPEVPLHLQPFIGIQLIQQLNARLADPAYANQREEIFEQQSKVVDAYTQSGTEFGRGVNAFKALSLLTPDGMVYWAQRSVDLQKDKLLKNYQAALNVIKSEIELAQERAKDEVSQNPLGDKLTALKKKRDEAKKAMLKELRGGLSSTGPFQALWAAARYGYYSVLAGYTEFQQWRDMMRDATGLDDKKIEEIWNTDFGKGKISEIADKIVGEVRGVLGNEDAIYNVLASYILDDVKDTDVAAKGQTSIGAEMTAEMKKALRRKAKELNTAYREKTKEYFRPRPTFSNYFRYRKPHKIIQKWLENAQADEVRDITMDKLQKVLLNGLEFQGLDADAIKELKNKYVAAVFEETIPHIRDRKAKDLAYFLHTKVGSVSGFDLISSLWYANVLSGPGTHLINTFANITQVAINGIIEASLIMTSPQKGKSGKALVQGVLEGIRVGFAEAQQIMSEGESIARGTGKLADLDTLEKFRNYRLSDLKRRWSESGGLKKAGALLGIYPASMKYIGRALAASDAFFYRTAYESKVRSFAARQASEKHPEGGEAWEQLYRQYLGELSMDQKIAQYDPELRAEVEAQLKEEEERIAALPKTDRIRALYDKTNDLRPEHIKAEGAFYGEDATFTHKPYGTLGVIANALNMINREIPAARLIVPFVNIVSNVLNEQLNYTPVGWLRFAGLTPSAFLAGKKGRIIRSSGAKDADHAAMLFMKGTMGTILLPILAYLLADDEEDTLPRITGKGPKDYSERKELDKLGWKPYSIRIGDTYVSYQWWPSGMVLGIIGTGYDRAREDGTKVENVQEFSKFAFAAMNSAPGIVLEASFLGAMASLIGNLVDDKPNKGAIKITEDLTSSAVRGMIPASSLLNSVDKAFNAERYRPLYVNERFVNRTPFLRNWMMDRIDRNAFGEPVVLEKGVLAVASRLLGLDRFGKKVKAHSKAEEIQLKHLASVPSIGWSFKIGGTPISENPEVAYRMRMLYGKAIKKELVDNYQFYINYNPEDQVTKKGNPQTLYSYLQGRLSKDKELIANYIEDGKTDREIIQLMKMEMDSYID